MFKISTIIFFLFSIALFFTACSSTKHLAPGQLFLKSNNVILKQSIIVLNTNNKGKTANTDTTKIKRSNINPIADARQLPGITRNIDNRKELRNSILTLVKQKTNTKILLVFPFNLWIYNITYTKRDKGLNWWIRNHVGEEPVVLDSNQCFNSMILMKSYLRNKGYLSPKVQYSIKASHKRANVRYFVYPGILYKYDTIRYISDNPNLTTTLTAAGEGKIIKRNEAFDIDILDKERDRIARFFQNAGYFRFNKNQLYYEWDTSATGQKVNLVLHLVQMADSLTQTVYNIKNVFVFPSYSLTTDTNKTLTTDTTLYHSIYIVSNRYERILKPFVINENIFLRPGALYSSYNSDNTLKRLNDIGTFKFVTVHFDYNDSGNINAFYYLTPYKRHSFQADFDVYNTVESPIGSGVKLSYKNRNLSHIALQFLLDVSTGIEITNFKYYKNESHDDYRIGVFNISPKVSLYWPRFIAFPGLNFLGKLFPKTNNPKTLVTVSYTYDERIKYFTLRSANVSFGYEEDLSVRTHIIWNLLSISYSQASNFDNVFKENLATNPILARSLQFKFIQGSNISYLHNNQRSQDQKRYYYFKVNFEYAGNLLRLISGLQYQGAHILSKNYWDTTRSFLLDGNSGYLRFAQYLKVDGDIRKYLIIDKRNLFVLRLASGTGLAYGNSSVMPYTKQFFIGGAAGLRGWQVYGLGPGTYHPVNSNQILFDQTGDLKLEMNGEYRFSFIGRLKGALFSDAGNIWDIRTDPTRPEGQFNNKKNLVLGWDGGIGLRVDFTFFIFRLDVATPFYDPTQLSGSRWISTFKPFEGKWLNQHAVFNFAVGYPF